MRANYMKGAANTTVFLRPESEAAAPAVRPCRAGFHGALVTPVPALLASSDSVDGPMRRPRHVAPRLHYERNRCVMRVKPIPVFASIVMAATIALAAPGPMARAADSTTPAASAPAAKPAATVPATPAPAAPKAPKHAKPPAPPPTGIGAPWGVGRHWMSFRIGNAKSNEEDAATGSIGGGIGFARMLSGKVWKLNLLSKFSLGGSIELNHLGSFGAASEIEVPATLDLTRHFRMGSDYFRPYLGFGAGAYYRKLYRTGDDFAETKPGYFVTTGVNLPLDPRHVIGVDLRFSHVNSINGPNGNPVFGPGSDSAVHWGIKFAYAFVY